jgi:2,3-dihydroxybenzoate decarboxylase/5-carboxyvanillate decarboxylase
METTGVRRICWSGISRSPERDVSGAAAPYAAPKRCLATSDIRAALVEYVILSKRIGDLKKAERKHDMLKIATEEAFSVKEVADALGTLAETGDKSLDMPLVRGIYGSGRSPTLRLLPALLDLENERLRDMDANGVDMHLLSLTAPGVQMFDAELGTRLARRANDYLAEVISRHPSRFAGLASFAPQNPAAAAREIERARSVLKLHGLVVNSHTHNEYYDNQKFWPIFEAAEALDLAIYIHPRAPSSAMDAAFRDYRMDGALWGYGIETSTHALRLIFSGLFDRFPKLKIVLGHMGEGIPFWLWRIDFMHNVMGMGSSMPSLKLKPSEYFKRNFAITTSGQENPLALRYSIDMLGVENVMWAIDYPYQPTAPAVAFMDTAPLSAEERMLVYGGNAKRIFHIQREE